MVASLPCSSAPCSSPASSSAAISSSSSRTPSLNGWKRPKSRSLTKNLTCLMTLLKPFSCYSITSFFYSTISTLYCVGGGIAFLVISSSYFFEPLVHLQWCWFTIGCKLQGKAKDLGWQCPCQVTAYHVGWLWIVRTLQGFAGREKRLGWQGGGHCGEDERAC